MKTILRAELSLKTDDRIEVTIQSKGNPDEVIDSKVGLKFALPQDIK